MLCPPSEKLRGATAAASDGRQDHAGLRARPAHIAIIMDGNGRWADRRHLPRSAGHRAGAKAVNAVVEAAARRGTPVVPKDMAVAPVLGPATGDRPVERRFALLLNPFYPKDPRANYGEHVLTPSLALTSIGGATPPHWRLRYWDENLLQGPPPADPSPEVVGITVHLTFARRSHELAAWYRAQGSLVILGGFMCSLVPRKRSIMPMRSPASR